MPTTTPHPDLPERDPSVGEMVRIRTRRWLVEQVTSAATPGESSRIRLDARGDFVLLRRLDEFDVPRAVVSRLRAPPD